MGLREDRTEYVGEQLADAVVLDRPVDTYPVEEWWDDVTLTAVVVPHLEHLLRYFIERGEKTTDGEEAEHAWEAEQALRRSIHLCREWRG